MEGTSGFLLCQPILATAGQGKAKPYTLWGREFRPQCDKVEGCMLQGSAVRLPLVCSEGGCPLKVNVYSHADALHILHAVPDPDNNFCQQTS